MISHQISGQNLYAKTLCFVRKGFKIGKAFIVIAKNIAYGTHTSLGNMVWIIWSGRSGNMYHKTTINKLVNIVKKLVLCSRNLLLNGNVVTSPEVEPVKVASIGMGNIKACLTADRSFAQEVIALILTRQITFF